MATSLVARWRYAGTEVDWNASHDSIRATLLEMFATTYSRALQETLYLMGTRVLETHDDVAEIRFSAPNKHHFLVDLEPFGLEQRRRGVHRRRPAVRPDRGDRRARRRPRARRRLARGPGVRVRGGATMNDPGLDYLVNCSMLFTERPLLERPAAARAAGFDADRVLVAVAGAAGARRCGGRRVRACDSRRRRAARRAELLRGRPRRTRRRRAVDPRPRRRSSATTSTSRSRIGEQLGVSAFNALYGNRVDGRDAPSSRTSSPATTSARRRRGGPDRRHRARRAGERPQALPAAHCR